MLVSAGGGAASGGELTACEEDSLEVVSVLRVSKTALVDFRLPKIFMVQEWLAMRYKASLEATETAMGPRPDGYQVSGMVGKFRAEFRMALRMVAIRRLGRMQRAAGLPPDCTRKAADLLQGWEGQQALVSYCM